MSRRKPTPHLFVPDPDVPPDHSGRRACHECHLMGRPGDERHTMPDLHDEDEEHRRRAGERGAAG